MAEFRLGIDFGTSTTKIALRRPGEPPIPLPIGQDGTTTYMPSVVAFVRRPGGEVQTLVGEEAEQATGAAFVVRSVKRCLTCNGDLCDAERRHGLGWCTGTGLISVPGVGELRPERIAFLIVEEAVRRGVRAARESLGLDLLMNEVVLAPVNFGCSSTFSLAQRHLLLRDVAHKIGFKAIDLRNLMEEPIAAGISYAKLAGVTGGKVLIYDFGGGTFDTAILDVDMEAGRITILAADGVPWLGGDDIDQIIYEHFLASIGREHALATKEVEERLGRLDQHELRRRCTEGKEALSDHLKFEDALFSEHFGMILLDLTRQQLEQKVLEKRFGAYNLIDRSLDCVLSTYRTAQTFELVRKGRLLDSGDISSIELENMADDIDRVVLVGGVTKMPLVRQRILDIFGEERVISQDVVEPINAVAVGAAYPRELDHFSLLYPPYSIQLVLSDEPDGRDRIVTLHQAYDKLEYFSAWPYNTLPICASPKHRIERGYRYARLRFVGDRIQADEIPLVSGASGDYYVSIDLAGRVQVNDVVVPGKELCRVPIRHPLQRKIIRAEEERRRQKEEEDRREELKRRLTIFTEKD